MVGKTEVDAMTGDLRTGCLIDYTGAIAWFCPSRVDAPACFANRVGSADKGHWLIGLCSDERLLVEAYDLHARRMLGTFPQACSHVRLVNSAYALMLVRERQTRSGQLPLPRTIRPAATGATP